MCIHSFNNFYIAPWIQQTTVDTAEIYTIYLDKVKNDRINKNVSDSQESVMSFLVTFVTCPFFFVCVFFLYCDHYLYIWLKFLSYLQVFYLGVSAVVLAKAVCF